jgi:glycosyltransferase involved in cell wall biosynthesis
MKHSPLVSVLMTSYNREKYIAEAINSVLSQTFTDFELIIVDDCSKDRTLEIVHSYCDERINVYQNVINLGQFKNRNRAASYALGEILLFVDSDDSITQNTLEHIVELFNKFPNSRFLTLNRDDFFESEMEVASGELIRHHLFVKSNLHYGPGATAIKKSLFVDIGGFPVAYGPVGDMFYNFKAALKSSVILCKYEFLYYRRHGEQEINNTHSYLFNGYLYFNDIMELDNLPLDNNEIVVLKMKNKRRFIINSILFLMKTMDLRKTWLAIKLAKFNFIDLREAIMLR